MKLLCISMEVPFPLNNGGSVTVFNRLRGLSERGHIIDLLCASKNQEEPASIAALTPYCETVKSFHVGRLHALGNALRRPAHPLRSTLRFHRGLQSDLDQLVCSGGGDALIIDHSPMAVYARPAYRRYVRLVLVVHALVHKSLTRIANELPAGNPRRILFRIEAALSRKFEDRIFRGAQFDEYWFYSEHDRKDVIAEYPRVRSRSCTLPPGVEMREHTAFSRAALNKPHSNEIVLVGSMDNVSNEDAARWFAEEILPRVRREVPHAHFIIVGKNSRPRLRDLDSDGVSVIGEVPDLTPYLQRSGVFVVPQRGGAGIRVKMLDGLAAGMVVISTAVGAEAMPSLVPGWHYLLARDAAEFAHQVTSVLRNPERFGDVARRGFDFVREHYSVEAAAMAAEERLRRLCNVDGSSQARSR